MGNDSSIEIFTEEDEKEAYSVNILGPKNESMSQFANRMFNRSLEILIQPDRMQYTSSQLIPSIEYSDEFTVIECDVKGPFDGELLHGVLWKNISNNNSNSSNSKRCVLYLHNNTRSVVDALEILTLCKHINADLLAFDLPGCGKSTGMLASCLNIYIDKILSWWISTNDSSFNDISVIIWSRGYNNNYHYHYYHHYPCHHYHYQYVNLSCYRILSS